MQLGDGAEFVKEEHQKFDVLLADGFDIGGLPDALCSLQYYDDCYKLLNPRNVCRQPAWLQPAL